MGIALDVTLRCKRVRQSGARAGVCGGYEMRRILNVYYGCAAPIVWTVGVSDSELFDGFDIPMDMQMSM